MNISREFYAKLVAANFAHPTLKIYAKKIRDKAFESCVGFELTGGLKDVKLMHAASIASSRSCHHRKDGKGERSGLGAP